MHNATWAFRINTQRTITKVHETGANKVYRRISSLPSWSQTHCFYICEFKKTKCWTFTTESRILDATKRQSWIWSYKIVNKNHTRIHIIFSQEYGSIFVLRATEYTSTKPKIRHVVKFCCALQIIRWEAGNTPNWSKYFLSKGNVIRAYIREDNRVVVATVWGCSDRLFTIVAPSETVFPSTTIRITQWGKMKTISNLNSARKP